jgi:hypothetical protein
LSGSDFEEKAQRNPERYHLSTLHEGYLQLKILGEEYPEPFEVVDAVEKYRSYWKPNKIRVRLVAGSHVHTTRQELQIPLVDLSTSLPDFPNNFVRFIYCLGYGESNRFKRRHKKQPRHHSVLEDFL